MNNNDYKYYYGTYKGNFLYNKRNGFGLYKCYTGDIYEGEWKNDKLYNGFLKFKRGNIYFKLYFNYEKKYNIDCEILNKTRMTKFNFNTDLLKCNNNNITNKTRKKIIYKNNIVYTGKRYNNMKNGKGVLKINKNIIYEGEWKNDLFIKGIILYKTDFAFVKINFDNKIVKFVIEDNNKHRRYITSSHIYTYIYNKNIEYYEINNKEKNDKTNLKYNNYIIDDNDINETINNGEDSNEEVYNEKDCNEEESNEEVYNKEDFNEEDSNKEVCNEKDCNEEEYNEEEYNEEDYYKEYNNDNIYVLKRLQKLNPYLFNYIYDNKNNYKKYPFDNVLEYSVNNKTNYYICPDAWCPKCEKSFSYNDVSNNVVKKKELNGICYVSICPDSITEEPHELFVKINNDDKINKINNVDTDVNSDVDTDVNNNVDSDVDTDVNNNVDSDVDTDVNNNVDSDVDTDVNNNVDSDVESDIDCDDESNKSLKLNNEILKLENDELLKNNEKLKLENKKFELENEELEEGTFNCLNREKEYFEDEYYNLFVKNNDLLNHIKNLENIIMKNDELLKLKNSKIIDLNNTIKNIKNIVNNFNIDII
jgi:hypothetical protein